MIYTFITLLNTKTSQTIVKGNENLHRQLTQPTLLSVSTRQSQLPIIFKYHIYLFLNSVISWLIILCRLVEGWLQRGFAAHLKVRQLSILSNKRWKKPDSRLPLPIPRSELWIYQLWDLPHHFSESTPVCIRFLFSSQSCAQSWLALIVNSEVLLGA